MGKRGGNWCGYGYTAAGQPVDEVDQACREHDIYYDWADHYLKDLTPWWDLVKGTAVAVNLDTGKPADPRNPNNSVLTMFRRAIKLTADFKLIDEINFCLLKGWVRDIDRDDIEHMRDVLDNTHWARELFPSVQFPRRRLPRIKPFPLERRLSELDSAAWRRQVARDISSNGRTVAIRNGLRD
jgi:hypothetical protein